MLRLIIREPRAGKMYDVVNSEVSDVKSALVTIGNICSNGDRIVIGLFRDDRREGVTFTSWPYFGDIYDIEDGSLERACELLDKIRVLTTAPDYDIMIPS